MCKRVLFIKIVYVLADISKLCISKTVVSIQRYMYSYQRATCSTPFEVMFGKTMNTNNSADIQKLISQEMIQNYNEQRENIRLAAKNQIRKIQKNKLKILR